MLAATRLDESRIPLTSGVAVLIKRLADAAVARSVHYEWATTARNTWAHILRLGDTATAQRAAVS